MDTGFGTSNWRGFTGTGRRGWSPRGGLTRGGYAGRGKRREMPKPDLTLHPLGELLTTINIADLLHEKEVSTAKITDCQYVASYSWLTKATPTILIPGKPPLWTPPSGPQQLNEDNADYFRDPNAARFPTYPTQPAVQTVLDLNPEFPTKSIDIFACGSTMGNLLRFARGVDKPFRFSAELIGNTLFFIRKENSPTEVIADIRGFGHTFPDAYTTWEADVKGSETHQRVIQYSFGGLKCLLRFESDGYLNHSPRKAPHAKSSSGKTGDDELLQALQDTSVSQAPATTTAGLRVENGGAEVPQASLFDLKTRSGKYKKEIDMEDFLPVLYLKQIPNFIVAYHNGFGRFTPHDIRVQNLEKILKDWEVENQEGLARLSVLLHKIIDLAKDDGNGLFEVYCSSANRLEVHRQCGEGSHALPLFLREEWARENQGVDLQDELYSDSDTGHGVGLEDYAVSDNDSDHGSKDFTACSAEDCGYCGRCTY